MDSFHSFHDEEREENWLAKRSNRFIQKTKWLEQYACCCDNRGLYVCMTVMIKSSTIATSASWHGLLYWRRLLGPNALSPTVSNELLWLSLGERPQDGVLVCCTASVALIRRRYIFQSSRCVYDGWIFGLARCIGTYVCDPSFPAVRPSTVMCVVPSSLINPLVTV